MNTMSAIVAVAFLGLPALAAAQSLSVQVDDAGDLTRLFDVSVGESFDVVTLVDTGGHDISAAEWVQTDLLVANPGVLLIGVTRICNTCDLLGETRNEFALDFGRCFPADTGLELVRLAYLDFGGYVGADTLVELRGLQPGDTQPSSFSGSSGFVDCSYNKFVAPMDGGDTLMTGAGVEVPSGALVLNPTSPVKVDGQVLSFTRIKASFR